MTPTPTATLVARDWAEIQERMLVPLYEAVYDRLEVGPGDRLLGLGCGAGLPLLLAMRPGRRRHGRGGGSGPAGAGPRTAAGGGDRSPGARGAAVRRAAGLLARPGRPRGGPARGPAGRGGGAGRLGSGGALHGPGGAGRGPVARDLDALVSGAGLVPDGSGRVFCPFGYADVDSAVRGLLSTGLYDAAADPALAEKELSEALHPYERTDGAVWLPNIFRYVVARVA